MSEIDKSFKRLGIDYVDFYIIYCWDYYIFIEEMMEVLYDVVKVGKVRYIGVFVMYVWQFQKVLYVVEKNGWIKFVLMQNYLNLIYCEEEREMLLFCKEEKIGVILYSLFVFGRLICDWFEIMYCFEID